MCIGATIRIVREILCPPYAGFFVSALVPFPTERFSVSCMPNFYVVLAYMIYTIYFLSLLDAAPMLDGVTMAYGWMANVVGKDMLK